MEFEEFALFDDLSPDDMVLNTVLDRVDVFDPFSEGLDFGPEIFLDHFGCLEILRSNITVEELEHMINVQGTAYCLQKICVSFTFSPVSDIDGFINYNYNDFARFVHMYVPNRVPIVREVDDSVDISEEVLVHKYDIREGLKKGETYPIACYDNRIFCQKYTLQKHDKRVSDIVTLLQSVRDVQKYRIICLGDGPAFGHDAAVSLGLNSVSVDISDTFIQLARRKGVDVKKKTFDQAIVEYDQPNDLFLCSHVLDYDKSLVRKLLDNDRKVLVLERYRYYPGCTSLMRTGHMKYWGCATNVPYLPVGQITLREKETVLLTRLNLDILVRFDHFVFVGEAALSALFTILLYDHKRIFTYDFFNIASAEDVVKSYRLSRVYRKQGLMIINSAVDFFPTHTYSVYDLNINREIGLKFFDSACTTAGVLHGYELDRMSLPLWGITSTSLKIVEGLYCCQKQAVAISVNRPYLFRDFVFKKFLGNDSIEDYSLSHVKIFKINGTKLCYVVCTKEGSLHYKASCVHEETPVNGFMHSHYIKVEKRKVLFEKTQDHYVIKLMPKLPKIFSEIGFKEWLQGTMYMPLSSVKPFLVYSLKLGVFRRKGDFYLYDGGTLDFFLHDVLWFEEVARERSIDFKTIASDITYVSALI
jgi:hypothetical protein